MAEQPVPEADDVDDPVLRRATEIFGGPAVRVDDTEEDE